MCQLPDLKNRIQFLKNQFFTHKPSVCIEGAISKTRIFKESEGESMTIRRAKAFREHCKTKTITIQPRELIVGNAGAVARSIHVCPELSNNWIIDELDTMSTRPQDPYQVTEEQKKIYREEIYPYWKGKTLRDYWNTLAPRDVFNIVSVSGVIDNDVKIECTPGDMVPAFPQLILPLGFIGIKERAEKNLNELDFNDIKNFERAEFWRSVIICCEGFMTLSKRYADEARRLLASADNEERIADLKKIAQVCDNLAEKAPKTFMEAIQLVYFVFVGLFIEGNAGGYSPGLLDQYLLPFYNYEKEQGTSDEELLEIIEAFYVKTGEQIWYWNEAAAKHYSGFCAFQNIAVGGLDKYGNDAVNPLSYMFLQAAIDVQMVQPSISVRISKKNPEEFFLKIAELVQTGSGFPAIFNDEVGYKMLLKKGIPAHMARDWAPIGCVEAQLAGRHFQWSSAGHYNLGSAVEFAVTNGIHLKTGKQLGLQTGDASKFTTAEEFENAVYAQVEYLLKQFSTSQNTLEYLHYNYLPVPVASMFIVNCLEKGLDLSHGGAEFNTGPGMNANGVADFIDSLAAVRKVIFQDKAYTMKDLVEAIKNDFVGYENLQKKLLAAPKWGNNDDRADVIVSELTAHIIKEAESYRGMLGNKKLPALYPVSSNVPQGMSVAALPSGRRAWKPLADGCSPSQGQDKLGPTAIIQSLGKLPHECIDGGTLLNIKLTPAVVNGADGKARLSAFIKTFIDLNVFHVQFNVVSHEVLRKAQIHPEEYKSLLVRVAGYSAYFVELSKDIQEDILSRTAHEL